MSNTQPQQTQEELDLSKAQMDKCIPIARQVLELIDRANLPIGDLKQADASKFYDEVRKSILQVMLNANLERQDVDLVGGLVLQPVSIILKGLEHALAISFQQAETQKWGKSVGEVTMLEMDTLIKSIPVSPVIEPPVAAAPVVPVVPVSAPVIDTTGIPVVAAVDESGTASVPPIAA